MWSRSQALAVGERVAAARKQAGLTQKDLARRVRDSGVAISETRICNLERGIATEATYGSAELLTAIAALTGVEPQWLVSGVEAAATIR